MTERAVPRTRVLTAAITVVSGDRRCRVWELVERRVVDR